MKSLFVVQIRAASKCLLPASVYRCCIAGVAIVPLRLMACVRALRWAQVRNKRTPLSFAAYQRNVCRIYHGWRRRNVFFFPET